jgi:hypothetical protein
LTTSSLLYKWPNNTLVPFARMRQEAVSPEVGFQNTSKGVCLEMKHKDVMCISTPRTTCELRERLDPIFRWYTLNALSHIITVAYMQVL